MQGLKAGNMALAFAVEIAMLAGFAFAGWAATDILWLRIILAIMLPGIAIAMWAVWAAPKASKKTRLKPRFAVSSPKTCFPKAPPSRTAW